MLAILIFIALVIEVLKYLTGGKSKDFWGGRVERNYNCYSLTKQIDFLFLYNINIAKEIL